MLDNLNFWEVGGLLLLALFIFGPERLPKVISDGLRMLRGARDMARNATKDLSREMGTEVSLEDLHPKTFIRKHLMSEEDEAQLRRPFEDAFREVKQISADANDLGSRVAQQEAPSRSHDSGVNGYDQVRPHDYDQVLPPDGQLHPYQSDGGGVQPRGYDTDAT